MLLTRPVKDNARIAGRLEDLGIHTLCWPLHRIVATEGPLEIPADADALVFTSANAVCAFSARSDVRALPAICVGRRTAGVARQMGFDDVTEAGGTVRALAARLAGGPHRRVFYPRGRVVSVNLADELAGADISLVEAVVYATEPGPGPESDILRALSDGTITVVTIWSRRNAQTLAQHLSNMPCVDLAGIDLVAISENAAVPLGTAGFRRIIPSTTPDADGMVATISAALRQETRNG